MEKAKISAIQLFVMMYFFELGSALVVSFGIGAKKDAWISILIGMVGGVLLFFMYYTLFRHYPNLSFTQYVRKICGKYIGWIIGLLYIVYWIYGSARNLRDFGDVLLTSTLPETPLLAINIMMILTVCYVLYQGIEVIGRTAEVFIVVILFLILVGNLLVYFSGNIKLGNLLPMLENGWTPILKTAFPSTTFFPFGEMLAFTMLLPYLNRPEFAKKVWLSALISSGLLLAYTTSLDIAVLGVGVVERSTFPLVATIGKINLFEFIQRLDAIVVFAFLVTMFFKLSIYFYVAIMGIADLFKFKKQQQIILPIGIIITFLSMVIASNFAEHIEEGLQIVPIYVHSVFQLIIPLCLLLVLMVRKWIKNKGN